MSGRPPIFNTPEEMQEIIDNYFAKCVPEPIIDNEGNVVTDKQGRPAYKHNPPTLTGLALALGFCSRGTIYEYEKKNDKFSYTIKKARLRCEHYVESTGLSGAGHPVFCIFALKNYGWKDKVQIEEDERAIEEFGRVVRKALKVDDQES